MCLWYALLYATCEGIEQEGQFDVKSIAPTYDAARAKRRARLYGIPEGTVSAILAKLNLRQGEHEVIKDIGQKYPLKIVVSVEKDTISVVTNYPVKKGRKK